MTLQKLKQGDRYIEEDLSGEFVCCECGKADNPIILVKTVVHVNIHGVNSSIDASLCQQHYQEALNKNEIILCQ